MSRALALALAVAASSTLLVAKGALGARPPLIRSCPIGINGADSRAALVDDVLAAARRVEIDHVMTHFQGRSELRSRLNTPVIEVVELGRHAPTLPGEATLTRLAAKRCGLEAATYSWAVVFHDGLDVVCCINPIVFVARTKTTWYVY